MSTVLTCEASVIVPTYRRPDLLVRCLQALQNQTLAPASYEIIVCDDEPSEKTRAAIGEIAISRPDGPAIHYVPVTGSQGPAAARNLGWRLSAARIIAFTDDDTMPSPSWLAAGLAAIDSGADASTGPIVMPLPENPTDLQLDAGALAQSEFATANCFVRRDVLNTIGGFDERFSMAWREDSDLHFSLLERGYAICEAPDAMVVHPLRGMKFGAGIGMQKKVLFDVLLYCKHPDLYREKIRRGPPWFYILVSGALTLSMAMLLTWQPALLIAAFTFWSLLTMYFFFLRLRRSALTMRNGIELLVTSVCIPPLSIFWRIVGISRYGAWFP